MFSTYEFHKHPLSNAFDPSGYSWYSVEVSLNTPWLLVEESIREDGGAVGATEDASFSAPRTLLLGAIQQLDYLLASQRIGLHRLSAVWIVTPGWVNGSGGWRMDRATRLWSAESDMSSEGDWQEVPLLEIESGQKLPFTLFPVDVSKVRNLRVKHEIHVDAGLTLPTQC